MIKTYDQFCDAVAEEGFMTFTRNPWGAPSLEDRVYGTVWGDELPDPPWAWKNRIAEQGKALYAHALGGRNVFVSMAWLPVFFAAYRPQEDIEERYAEGLVENLTLRVAREMRAMPRRIKADLRAGLGLTGKEKGRMEGALNRLEREMFLSIGATTHKRNKRGEPYGWGVNELWLCEAFYAKELELAEGIDREEARERIRERIREAGGEPDGYKLF
jgi:hypothetical protein